MLIFLFILSSLYILLAFFLRFFYQFPFRSLYLFCLHCPPCFFGYFSLSRAVAAFCAAENNTP